MKRKEESLIEANQINAIGQFAGAYGLLVLIFTREIVAQPRETVKPLAARC
jgi:hypothetical protein